MNALNDLAKLRVSASRFQRGRWDLVAILLTIVGIAALISLSVSFWIFFQSEGVVGELTQSPTSNLLRKNIQGQVSVFKITDDLTITNFLHLTRLSTFQYEHAHVCETTKWVSSITSEWTINSKAMIIPVLCTESNLEKTVEEIMRILDHDVVAAGMKIIWIMSSPVSAVETRRIESPDIHFVYPDDFFVVNDDKEEHGVKIGIWRTGDGIEKIQTRQYCEYSYIDVKVLSMFVQHGCIPVVYPRIRLPLVKLIEWKSAVIRLEEGQRIEDAVDTGKTVVLTNALSAIKNKISTLSKADQVIYQLAFT